jgi:hypothetical protein
MVSLVGHMIVGGKGGDGAKGGNATAKATAMDGPIALATATGGAGGSAGGPRKTKDGAFGGAGDGGTADATASATNSTGNALAVSQASGGNGGLLQPGTKNTARATPGNAMATATANAPKGVRPRTRPQLMVSAMAERRPRPAWRLARGAPRPLRRGRPHHRQG